ncbi:autoinducer-2 kinase [Neobacillus sp. MM2021_6]|uniref:autoinducer-2 kinase n=1 Tax=Bacillaceae TaxID=186817 RepID=UPI00140C64F2|nr:MULTISPECIES: autoinducer-2 kinase [Bacillaceae]MBO0962277.1 autoinducer-2 kinase [Neobacillus sp. MM2021_6]NHC19426.1 autoinducer-2 kinase [Bacillus sp. MM2020_4]
MEKYLMAIDAGTGSVRVILFDTLGNEHFVTQSEWTHNEDKRYPGSQDFDINQNMETIIHLIKEILAKSKVHPENIVSISTTSMREAIVLYDENGQELWACANVDSRSNDEVANLYKISDTIEAEIHHVSGQTFSLGAIPRILWVKKNIPETYERVKYVTMLNDWITYRLTDVISVEPSNGCTTGLFDIKNRVWDPRISEKVGLRNDIFPVVNESGSIIGHVTEEFSALSGLSTQTLVIAGGGDAQLGCIGMGVINEGDAAVLGGSFWQYEYTTNHVEINDQCKVRVNCHALPNTWQYEAIAFFPGLIMRWFRDTFCELEALLQKESGESIYDQMEKRAQNVPAGSHGMICTFSDKMNYFSWKHAAPSFVDFKFDGSFNKATFYRAIMENAAFVTKGNIEMVSKITKTSPESIVFGGGASKSDLWCQILADVLNRKVKIPVVKESTALGAAICAGVGAGVYLNFKEAIDQVVKFEKTFEPNVSNHFIYEELYKKWEAIYKVQLDLADQGVTEHMWIAPGL